MPLGSVIITLGWVMGCTQPTQAPTGPPHLLLVLADHAPAGLTVTPVFPVANGATAHRAALMTGTWAGFPARHELDEVLKAVGYEVLTGDTPPPSPHIPHFTLIEDGSQPSAGPHTLQITVGTDPDSPFLVLSGDASPAQISGPATLLDVMPTLLDAAGTVAPAGSPGRSLLDPAAPLPEAWFQVGSEDAWTARTTTQTVTWLGSDLGALAEAALDDPRFTWAPPDLSPSEDLRSSLVRWRVSLSQDPTAPPVDPALREVLQQRGYW